MSDIQYIHVYPFSISMYIHSVYPCIYIQYIQYIQYIHSVYPCIYIQYIHSVYPFSISMYIHSVYPFSISIQYIHVYPFSISIQYIHVYPFSISIQYIHALEVNVSCLLCSKSSEDIQDTRLFAVLSYFFTLIQILFLILFPSIQKFGVGFWKALMLTKAVFI